MELDTTPAAAAVATVITGVAVLVGGVESSSLLLKRALDMLGDTIEEDEGP